MNPKTTILHKFKAFTSLFLIFVLLLPNAIPTAPVFALPEEYPIKLSVTTDNQSVYLDWTMMDAGITGFVLTRATDADLSENVTSWEFDAQTLKYADNLVLPGITYYYRVVAYSDPEKIGESNIESVCLPIKSEDYSSDQYPDTLTANIDGQNVLLQWTDNFPETIQVSLQRGTNFEFSENLTILEVDIENASYSDNAVLPGITYYYRLVSQDSTARHWQSNIVSISVPGLLGIDSTESLPVPTNLKAEVEDDSIVLSWEIADLNIIGFRIEKSNNEDFSADIVTIQTSNTIPSFSDHYVLAGATYYYRVYALGLGQISVASDVVEATVPANRDNSNKEVPVPQDLSAWISQSQQVLLFWTCNTTDVRGFFVVRAKDPGFKESLVASVVKGGVTLHTDNTVEAGNTYYYRVHTWNQFGVSPPSGVIAVSLPAGDSPVYREELPSPLNLSLSPTGPKQGIIRWSNDKTDSLGFLILRSTDANFVENVRVTKVNAGDTNYVDNAIVPGVEYFYRIYSWDKTRISASFGALTVLVPSSSKLPQTRLLVRPEQRVEIKSPSGKLSLVIPSGALERQTQIVVTEYNPETDNTTKLIEGRPPLSLFSLEATDIGTAETVDVFRDNLEIRIRHDPEDWTIVDPESLHLYYLNEKTQQWEIISGMFNRDTNELVATTNHFSVYGEQGNLNIVGPGRVMASQVNLHSGTATYSYPLELPVGPGGFQPKLELQYNSGSVDEMKDRLAVGSWVGIGWSLSLGQIGFNATEGKYYLDLNGSSYELTASDNEYYIKPVSYYKITRTSNTWTMIDREGVTYVFGDSDSSRLYINNAGSKTYYTWNLTLMQDTNGNKATVSYVQDIRGSSPNEWVRSIYPSYLRYGYVDASTYKMEILFNIGHDGATSDGYLRSDNPVSYSWYESYQCIVGYAWIPDSCDGACYVYFQWPYYSPPYPSCSQTPCYIPGHYDYSQPIYGTCYSSGSNPAPKVMENRRLNSIDVKVNGSTLRQYVFDYTTTSRVFDGSARKYFAGTMKLNSITEQYPTGNQQDPWDNPPIVSFTYTNRDVRYYYDSPITWPFLTAVNSGYGGTVSFGYTQIPSTPTTIWTRQAVTSRTIDSGSNDSADEANTFSYTGNPAYVPLGTAGKFRGWNEVRETDAAGHYTMHYFFTTGTQEGKDGDKLTGREYRTLWYAAGGQILQEQLNNWIYPDVTGGYAVQLADTQTKTYNASNPGVFRTTKVSYSYDNYGNTVTENDFGDTSDIADGSIVSRQFVPNTALNILSEPAWEKVFAATESGGILTAANTTKETYYYYDNGVDQYHDNSDWNVAPVKGNITRLEQKENAVDSVSSNFTYDSFGNKVTETDPNGNTTTYTIDTTYHIFPEMKTCPEVDGGIFSENCTYSPGTGDILTHTDINGQMTIYGYDYFNRLTSVDKPGGRSPDVTYDYLAWGTVGQQCLLTRTYSDADNFTWEKQFFDGLGRIIQVQSSGEPQATHTIISSTTTYNNRGFVDRQYVSQDVASSLSTYYNSGIGTWKYTSFAYDALGRVTTQTNADGSTVTSDYSSVWQTLTSDENGHKKRNYYDAFARLSKVEELDESHQTYSTTTYAYDVLGNLTRVTDDAGNTTNMTYNWLSQKVLMEDPDMGCWSYDYDDNGNLISQTDAENQTITFTYDALDRLVAKTYPQGSGMADIVYTFDDYAGGNYGKNKRTGMIDAAGTISFKYDDRGRLIQENRVSDNVSYVTSYSYDNADRLLTITYPDTGSGRETVIQQYDERGLPDYLSGSVAGPLVSNTIYSQLGQMNEIDLGNGLKTTFSYWGLDHETASYGKLWEITTSPQGEGDPIQQVRHTWDAGGNLILRQNLISSENETFAYDFLDRLETIEGAYSENYTYSTIGNIDTKNGIVYLYGENEVGPHAVTTVGQSQYDYDANGNMITRGGQTIIWDVENRPVEISDNETVNTFTYDGDGKRIKKIENGETILYVNRYYEVNLTTNNATTSYYLGDKLIAQQTGDSLRYIHQDHLGGTSVVSSENGTEVTSINFCPFGATRSGNVPTDKKFTGQRLDGTGLYYYGARYYDAQIGRFISADTILADYANPQALNRYSYVLNNPLKYVDPNGRSPVLWLTAMFTLFRAKTIDTSELTWGLVPANGLNIGNALHEIAQVVAATAISERYGNAALEYKVDKRKEADIVAGNQVWEVKPLGGKSPDTQLEVYTMLGGLERGDNTPFRGQTINVSMIGNIKMEVSFGEKPGEIYYECYKNRGDGKRVYVPNWQVLWEFTWRKAAIEVGAGAIALGIIFAPGITIPLVEAAVVGLGY
jgi:RHS repeat-associated protein